MSDLVQKIAKDACRILGYSMVDSIVHEKLREAIRQALADAGEPVATLDDDQIAALAEKIAARHDLKVTGLVGTRAAAAIREALTLRKIPTGKRVAVLQRLLTSSLEVEYDCDRRITELEAQLAESRERVARAYGLLWHVNAGVDAPWGTPSLTPERAAMESRKVLRDMLTNEQRGDGINAARDIMKALAADKEKK